MEFASIKVDHGKPFSTFFIPFRSWLHVACIDHHHRTFGIRWSAKKCWSLLFDRVLPFPTLFIHLNNYEAEPSLLTWVHGSILSLFAETYVRFPVSKVDIDYLMPSPCPCLLIIRSAVLWRDAPSNHQWYHHVQAQLHGRRVGRVPAPPDRGAVQAARQASLHQS